MRQFVARKIIPRRIIPIFIVPFIIAAIVFIPQMIVQRTFTPRLFEPRNIDKTRSHLDPVRNLVGKWTGSATFRDSVRLRNYTTGGWDADPAYCTLTYNVTMNISNQTNQAMTGNINFKQTKGEMSEAYKKLYPGTNKCNRNEDYTFNFNAPLSSSSIQNFNLPRLQRQLILGGAPANAWVGFGSFSGSYTTDTITLSQTAVDEVDSSQGRQLLHPINLLRQGD